MNKREIVRKFFIEHYNQHVVVGNDIKKTEERSQRYNFLLNYYMDLMEENECGCFDYEFDIVDGLSKNYESNLAYILSGESQNKTF